MGDGIGTSPADSSASQAGHLLLLLQDGAFAIELARGQQEAYDTYTQGENPSPFLPQPKRYHLVPLSVARSLAGFYALEAGLAILSEVSDQNPLDVLRRIVVDGPSGEESVLFSYLANATWKAGQPFTSPENIHRHNFVPFEQATKEDVGKAIVQSRAAGELFLTELERRLGDNVSPERQWTFWGEILHDQAFAVKMAAWLHSSYHLNAGHAPPSFDPSPQVVESFHEELASNLAAFYALECGAGFLAARNHQSIPEILKAVERGDFDGTRDMRLLEHFAHATWKAGQPFRGLHRLGRRAFAPVRPGSTLPGAREQVKSAVRKVLQGLELARNKEIHLATPANGKRHAQPEDFLAEIQRSGRRVIVLAGFSSPYEDSVRFQKLMEDTLGLLNPDEYLINIGATETGIGGTYRTAKDLGFATAGNASARMVKHGLPDAVDLHTLIGYAWGSESELTVKLAFAGTLLVIGGGEQTYAEAERVLKEGGFVIAMPGFSDAKGRAGATARLIENYSDLPNLLVATEASQIAELIRQTTPQREFVALPRAIDNYFPFGTFRHAAFSFRVAVTENVGGRQLSLVGSFRNDKTRRELSRLLEEMIIEVDGVRRDGDIHIESEREEVRLVVDHLGTAADTSRDSIIHITLPDQSIETFRAVLPLLLVDGDGGSAERIFTFVDGSQVVVRRSPQDTLLISCRKDASSAAKEESGSRWNKSPAIVLNGRRIPLEARGEEFIAEVDVPSGEISILEILSSAIRKAVLIPGKANGGVRIGPLPEGESGLDVTPMPVVATTRPTHMTVGSLALRSDPETEPAGAPMLAESGGNRNQDLVQALARRAAGLGLTSLAARLLRMPPEWVRKVAVGGQRMTMALLGRFHRIGSGKMLAGLELRSEQRADPVLLSIALLTRSVQDADYLLQRLTEDARSSPALSHSHIVPGILSVPSLTASVLLVR